MRNDSGFTIIELMIVIGLAAVLTTIAGYNYFSYRPSLLLSGATRQIMGDLLAAKMKAVGQSNNYKIFFLNEREYMVLDDDDNDGVLDGGEWSQTKDIQTEYPGVTFTATDDPVFTSRGTANNVTTVTLTNSGSSKQISIYMTGYVEIG